jgi:hypothetical protein
MLLLEIWLERVGVEFFVVYDLDAVACKTIFSVLQYTSRAAGKHKCCRNKYIYDA